MKCFAKRLLAVILCGCTILTLAACGGSAPASSTPPASDGNTSTQTPADENITLTVWVREQVGTQLKLAVEAYKQKAPNVTINLSEYPDQQLMDQFTLSLSSNSAPDIISMDDVFAPYFSSLGGFADITERYNALPYKDSFNGFMSYLGSYEGVQYGVPFTPDLSALLYNKKHFREVGLDPDKGPVTWDDLKNYAQKLTTAEHYGYVYAGGSAGGLMFTFMPYIWGNKGSYLNKDGTQAVINSPEAVEALQLYYDLTNTLKVCPPSTATYSYGEAMDAFMTGKSSMVVLGNANVYSIVKDYPDFELGVALIPKNGDKGGHSSFVGGDVLAITEQCKNKDAAWAFIEYMLSEEVQVEVLAKNGNLPARGDLYDNKYFKEIPLLDVFKDAINVGAAEYTLKYGELYNPLLDAVQSAMTSKATPQAAFDKAVEVVSSIVKG